MHICVCRHISSVICSGVSIQLRIKWLIFRRSAEANGQPMPPYKDWTQLLESLDKTSHSRSCWQLFVIVVCYCRFFLTLLFLPLLFLLFLLLLLLLLLYYDLSRNHPWPSSRSCSNLYLVVAVFMIFFFCCCCCFTLLLLYYNLNKNHSLPVRWPWHERQEKRVNVDWENYWR